MDAPETQYANSGGISIAYQVVGDGAIDLLVAPGFISHLDLFWTLPAAPRFFGALASFARVIFFDKRGTGLSDPVESVPTLQDRIDDMRVVLDAVDSKRAALFGISEGGPMSVLFAATYPERVSALVLYGSVAYGRDPEFVERWSKVRALADDWGKGNSNLLFSPSMSGNVLMRRLVAVYERASASPAMARALTDALFDIDVRAVLPSIQAPTIVIHREHEQVIPVSQGRMLADGIPGAKLMLLPGTDHNPWIGDHTLMSDTISRFLTGQVTEQPPDRILTTLLFTDIVGSTERASSDAGWRELLNAHNKAVRDAFTTYRGHEVNTTGDGFLAIFDGPGRAIECAGAIRDAVRALGIEIRAGVHTGEVEVIDADLTGVAVHLAARVCAAAGPSEIVVTGTVKDLVTGAGVRFSDLGTHALKGVPGTWPLYSVAGRSAQSEAESDAIAEPVHERLSRFDRAAVRMARRAPGLSRLFARAAGAPR
ncbi:MAG TPA: adenylate/guanylate cyclase domain-containing protein [Acidimicrobiales bacterium]|nr:adenylate/guanylate cyclase domain-containing protein [Acidimicrobiales bacterium]